MGRYDDFEMFKKRTKELIKETYKRQRDFAEDYSLHKMGVSAEAALRYLNKKKPPIAFAVGIAEFFNVSLDYLFGLIDEKDNDIKFISDYTGLSEKAVNSVFYTNKQNEKRARAVALSDILSNRRLLEILLEYVNMPGETITDVMLTGKNLSIDKRHDLCSGLTIQGNIHSLAVNNQPINGTALIKEKLLKDIQKELERI